MSVWDEEFEGIDKEEFEQWLDSINESGDPARDKEYFDKEMAKQKHLHKLAEGNLEDAKMLSLQDGVETVDSGPTPDFDVYSEEYKMTVSNN